MTDHYSCGFSIVLLGVWKIYSQTTRKTTLVSFSNRYYISTEYFFCFDYKNNNERKCKMSSNYLSKYNTQFDLIVLSPLSYSPTQ